jgi:ribose transport system substrate-binding protein
MRQRLAGLAVLALVAAAACGGPRRSERTTRPTIAVIPKGTTLEFWKSVHAGAVKASRELGVEIVWKGPLKEDSREEQIKVVEDFISRGVSGIVLAPLDDTALRVPVSDAARSGIPVVIIDSALKGTEFISFVATDNENGGRMAAEHLAKLLGDKGRVAVLRHIEGSASTNAREKGFLEAMGAHQGIAVVSSSQYGGVTTESAYQASENLLAAHTKTGRLALDGLFCPNESTTFGMLRALQDAKLAGSVKFVGFDSSDKLVVALRQGEISALVLQRPFDMGYLGVKTVAEHLKGSNVPPRIDTGASVATSKSMDSPEIRELLSPDLSRWLQ